MKDEIKEINKIIDNTSYNEEFTYFQTSHISKLVDYITNLQEEIERQSKSQVILDNQITQMYDYKLRNEEAIEYIKEKAKNNCWIDQYEANDLIKILNGGDNNG